MCVLDLTLSGDVAVTFPDTMRAQLGSADDSEHWEISSEVGEALEVLLGGDLAMPMMWTITAADTDGDGPQRPFFLVHLYGPPEGGITSTVVDLRWYADPMPEARTPLEIGSVDFDGPYIVVLDVVFNRVESATTDPSGGPVPNDARVGAVGAIRC